MQSSAHRVPDNVVIVFLFSTVYFSIISGFEKICKKEYKELLHTPAAPFIHVTSMLSLSLPPHLSLSDSSA
jgi:hypothetical protein